LCLELECNVKTKGAKDHNCDLIAVK